LKTIFGGKKTVTDSSTMNEELKEWIQETHAKVAQEQKDQSNDPEPTGFCALCSDNKAKYVCQRCKRNVCPSCYFQLVGLCKSCVEKETADKWQGKTPDWEKLLGVKWVD
jgi:hypothetical protein